VPQVFVACDANGLATGREGVQPVKVHGFREIYDKAGGRYSSKCGKQVG